MEGWIDINKRIPTGKKPILAKDDSGKIARGFPNWLTQQTEPGLYLPWMTDGLKVAYWKPLKNWENWRAEI